MNIYWPSDFSFGRLLILNLIHLIKAYKDFFRLLIEVDSETNAVLWHCTDGKDRAGLAAALLLAALGADMKTILVTC